MRLARSDEFSSSLLGGIFDIHHTSGKAFWFLDGPKITVRPGGQSCRTLTEYDAYRRLRGGQPPAGFGLRQTRSNGSRQAWGATS
jgi:hypothetical protein